MVAGPEVLGECSTPTNNEDAVPRWRVCIARLINYRYLFVVDIERGKDEQATCIGVPRHGSTGI